MKRTVRSLKVVGAGLLVGLAFSPGSNADVLVQVHEYSSSGLPALRPETNDLRIYLGPEAARIENPDGSAAILRYDSEEITPLGLPRGRAYLEFRMRKLMETRQGKNSPSLLRLQGMGETKAISGIDCTRYLARGKVASWAGGEGRRQPDTPETELEIELWVGPMPGIDAMHLAHVLTHYPLLAASFPFTTEELGGLPGVPLRTEAQQHDARKVGVPTTRIELLSATQVEPDASRYLIPDQPAQENQNLRKRPTSPPAPAEEPHE
jgi:hypothetical protein